MSVRVWANSELRQHSHGAGCPGAHNRATARGPLCQTRMRQDLTRTRFVQFEFDQDEGTVAFFDERETADFPVAAAEPAVA
jgi:hypothetical protein